MNIRLLARVAVAAALALLPAPALAAVLYVAPNGTDVNCGPITQPCLTIGQAIANAVDGDHVIVGPGVYGDVKGDGSFTGPGAECAVRDAGTCVFVVVVNKRIVLDSSAGAGATSIVAPAGIATQQVVSIQAPGVVFGRRGRGFTLRGAVAGVGLFRADLTGPLANARVEGNFVMGSLSGIDAEATTRALLTGNLLRATQTGIFVGEDGIVDGNVVVEGIGVGINATDEIGTITDNYLLGNRFGIETAGGSGQIVRNTIAENTETGIVFGSGSYGPLMVTSNNIFANDLRPISQNCGVTIGAAQVLNLERNYWGSATGPGPDPADAVCIVSPGVAPDTTPFATRPFAINNTVGR